MSTGWIKLHRQLLDWEWYDDMNTKCLYLHCLLRANHSDTKWRGIDVKKGQFITSLDSLAKETGLSVQNIRTSINKLKSTGNLTSKQQAKARIITVVGWDSYQDTNKETNRELTGRQQATNRQLTPDKNVRTKECENVNKDSVSESINNLSVITDGFNHWWNLYPSARRKNKGGCFNKFKAKCKKLTAEQVEDLVNTISVDIEKRAAEVEDLKYMPMTEPYLNQERWNDGQ